MNKSSYKSSTRDILRVKEIRDKRFLTKSNALCYAKRRNDNRDDISRAGNSTFNMLKFSVNEKAIGHHIIKAESNSRAGGRSLRQREATTGARQLAAWRREICQRACADR